MISALMELMNNFYHNGNLTQLEAVARTILTSIPDDVVSLHFLGLAYIKTGRQQDASRLFQRLRRHKMEFTVAKASDSDRAAAVVLREATDLNPHYADTWHELALELAELGQAEQAVEVLRHAIAARPPFIKALRDLGRLGLRAGDLDAAYEAYRGVLAVQPSDNEALRGLQDVLERRLAKRATLPAA